MRRTRYSGSHLASFHAAPSVAPVRKSDAQVGLADRQRRRRGGRRGDVGDGPVAADGGVPDADRLRPVGAGPQRHPEGRAVEAVDAEVPGQPRVRDRLGVEQVADQPLDGEALDLGDGRPGELPAAVRAFTEDERLLGRLGADEFDGVDLLLGDAGRRAGPSARRQWPISPTERMVGPDQHGPRRGRSVSRKFRNEHGQCRRPVKQDGIVPTRQFSGGESAAPCLATGGETARDTLGQAYIFFEPQGRTWPGAPVGLATGHTRAAGVTARRGGLLPKPAQPLARRVGFSLATALLLPEHPHAEADRQDAEGGHADRQVQEPGVVRLGLRRCTGRRSCLRC